MVGVKLKKKEKRNVFLKSNSLLVVLLVVKMFSAFGPIFKLSVSHTWIIINTQTCTTVYWLVNLVLDLKRVSLTALLLFSDTNRCISGWCSWVNTWQRTGPGSGTSFEDQRFFSFQIVLNRDFPGGAVVKNPPANTGDMGSIPGLGRSPHAAEQRSPCATTTEPVL